MKKVLIVLGVLSTFTALQSCNTSSQPPKTVGDWRDRDDDEDHRERRRHEREEDDDDRDDGGVHLF